MKQEVIVAQRSRIYADALQRAGTDTAFRARLKAKPRQTLDALAEELGLEARVPTGVDIEILEASAEKLHLVLPPLAEGSLMDSELERVVGGAGVLSSPRLSTDAHGCPACPHPAVGPMFR